MDSVKLDMFLIVNVFSFFSSPVLVLFRILFIKISLMFQKVKSVLATLLTLFRMGDGEKKGPVPVFSL